MSWEIRAKIIALYDERHPHDMIERELKQLKSHWGRMHAKCKEFNSYHCQTRRDWQTEVNNEDIYNKADTLFYPMNKVPFKYKGTWRELIKCPKFHQTSGADVSFDKRQKGTDRSSNSSRSFAPEEYILLFL